MESIEWLVLRLQHRLDELTKKVKQLENGCSERETIQKVEENKKDEINIDNTLEEELMTTKKVLQILDMSYNTLQGLVNKGKLKALRISPRKIRFRRSDLNAYIASLSD